MARSAMSLNNFTEVVSQSNLPDERKKWLSYCIRRFGSTFGRDMTMEVNETTILKRPDLHSAGLTAASLANLQSGVRAALRLAHRDPPVNLSAAWTAAIARVHMWDGAGKRRMIMCLPSFGRYCTGLGIDPGKVSADIFAGYEEYSTSMLVRDPKLRSYQAQNAWNAAARAISGWPGQVVSRPPRAQLGLPLADLPPALARELAVYEASKGLPIDSDSSVEPAVVGGALAFLALADSVTMRHQARHSAQGGRSKRILRPLSDSSLRDHVFALRHAASAALRAGQSQESVSTIAQVATVAVAAEAAAEVERKSRASGYTARQRKLFCQLRDVRCRWVGTDSEWKRLHAAATAIEQELQRQGVKTSGMSQKTRNRLAVFESFVAVVKLLTVQDRLLDQAELRRKAGRPVRYRDALDVAVAVALMVEFTKPLRLSNLAELRLEWLRLPERRNEPGSLAVPACEVKNQEPLFATLSARKVKSLKIFITHYRKHLTDQPNSPWLFPSQVGDRHKPEGRLGHLIVNRVHAMTGLVINVHLLRGVTAALLYR